MHEPLSRDWRIKHGPNPTLALVRACAFVVVLAVALVGLALIVGEFSVRGTYPAGTTARLTTGSATGARDAAQSSNDLFSGMPLP